MFDCFRLLRSLHADPEAGHLRRRRGTDSVVENVVVGPVPVEAAAILG
jgi:hypothetical protein